MSRATARTLDGWAAYPVEAVVRYDGAFVLVRTVHGDYWAHRAYVTVTQGCPTRGVPGVLIDPDRLFREQERQVAAWLVEVGAGALVMRETFDYGGAGSVVEVRVFCTIDQTGVPSCRSGAVACGEPVGDEPNCARTVEVTPGPPPQFIIDKMSKEQGS